MSLLLPATAAVEAPFPDDLDLVVRGRNPLRLAAETASMILEQPIPASSAMAGSTAPIRASVIIVTRDNLILTKLCLHSLLAHTESPAHEVIVVDNASTDGTPEYLHALAAAHAHVRVICNHSNRGFASANNQGLAIARGDTLVLLNNDTIVAPGWLDGLANHLADASVGTICATTNRIGNEAEIETAYRTFGELCRFAAARLVSHRGKQFDIPMAPMFCHAMRREVFDRVGPLDEAFAVGMFEDDDYAMRVRAAGLRVACADDIFVHHFGGASFGRLIPTGQHATIFRANRERYETKWGVAWQPHRKREALRDVQASERMRDAVRAAVAGDSIIAVISKGDESLLTFGDGIRAWHFPRLEDGSYAGHYPADSAAAIAHLESLRAQGATHLLIPASSAWWLEHYAEFAQHLVARYTSTSGESGFQLFHLRSALAGELNPLKLQCDEQAREIALLEAQLNELRATANPSPAQDYRRTIDEIRVSVAKHVPEGGTLAVITRGDEEILKLHGLRTAHFPRTRDGRWSGEYPADGAEAVALLLATREQGADYFLIPWPAFWWLDYYPALAAHLDQHATLLHRDGACALYDLRPISTPAVHDADADVLRHVFELLDALLPKGASVAILSSEPVAHPRYAHLRELHSTDASYLVIPDVPSNRTADIDAQRREAGARFTLIASRPGVCDLFTRNGGAVRP
jgi:GT2 family glycosyltransferase